ncbi:MAG: Glycosyltransferase, RfaG family [Candidatus Methanohalarchaeum thermophilum]|uniref:Glycosyltransferase, RfaG family n=1 Tax=Methanohalarchaeum thermophilum TaxID=1903181 RepID=A0A1Q6DST2_METT1|nr:MAG: Glycosyltransferase, RfaG family [Candidatus Methanohalarchaeum thermophilum]
MAYHSKNLAEGLSQLGHEIHVLTSSHPNTNNRYSRNGVQIHRIKTSKFGGIDAVKKFSFLIKAKKKAKNLDNKYDFDLIHSHGNSGVFVSLNKPFVMKCHSLWADEIELPFKKSWLKKQYMKIDSYLEKKAIKKADLIVSVSKKIANSIKKRYNKESKVVYNGVPDIMEPKDVDKENQILNVSAFSKRKGCHLFPNILEEIDEKYSLLHIGPIPEKKLFKKVLKKLKEKKMRDRFNHIDFISQEKLPRHYSQSKIYIHPSLYEAFGNTPMEAIACGTTSLVSNQCGCSELSNKIRNLVPTNINRFSSKIRYILKNKLVNKQNQENTFKKDWKQVGLESQKFFKKII